MHMEKLSPHVQKTLYGQVKTHQRSDNEKKRSFGQAGRHATISTAEPKARQGRGGKPRRKRSLSGNAESGCVKKGRCVNSPNM